MISTNLLNHSVKRGATLLGAVGLGAIAFLGMPDAAKAVDVKLGTDYLFTPAASYKLTGIGIVPLKGLPINPALYGSTDTMIERPQDCTFNTPCPIQIQALSLQSVDPVPAIGSYIFVTLNGSQTQGSMTIQANGTWNNLSLPVTSVAKDANGTVLGSDAATLIGSGTWVSTPPGGYPAVGINNGFFPTGTLSDDNKIHEIVPTPEPLTILGTGVVLGAIPALKKEYAKRKKKKDGDA